VCLEQTRDEAVLEGVQRRRLGLVRREGSERRGKLQMATSRPNVPAVPGMPGASSVKPGVANTRSSARASSAVAAFRHVSTCAISDSL
jgi:hypothetical protein